MGTPSSYLSRLAARVGFRPGGNEDEVDDERRRFLRGLLATGALVAMPSGLLVPAAPQSYQVTTELLPAEWTEIRLATGQLIRLRDFREDDKYDSILVRSPDAEPAEEFKFYSDPVGRRQPFEAEVSIMHYATAVIIGVKG